MDRTSAILESVKTCNKLVPSTGPAHQSNMSAAVTRSSTRLRKGAPDPPTWSTPNKKLQSRAETTRSQTGSKRPKQHDGEDGGPPTKRITLSKPTPKSALKASEDPSKESNKRLVRLFEKQVQKPNLGESVALPGQLTRLDTSISPANSAVRSVKSTGRKVAFVPMPYKQPLRRTSA